MEKPFNIDCCLSDWASKVCFYITIKFNQLWSAEDQLCYLKLKITSSISIEFFLIKVDLLQIKVDFADQLCFHFIVNDVVVPICDNLNITLPEVVDDDSDKFWIELDPSTPSWITLIGNSTLEINILDANWDKTQTIQLVAFKLSDDSGAVVHPKLKLLIDSSMLFVFNQFDNIKTVYKQRLEISVGTGVGKDIRLVDWTTGQLVKWSSYSTEYSNIMINTTDPNSFGTHCVQAAVVDGWGKTVHSNQFNITIKVKSPPTILAKFDSIKLMKGEIRVFQYR